MLALCLVQVLPWILDVGYTVMCVALMLAVMGHVLFGDFEVTVRSLPDSISGKCSQFPLFLTWSHHPIPPHTSPDHTKDVLSIMQTSPMQSALDISLALHGFDLHCSSC